jgi:hypothetical protein
VGGANLVVYVGICCPFGNRKEGWREGGGRSDEVSSTLGRTQHSGGGGGGDDDDDDVDANKTGSDSVRRSFQALLSSRSLFLHAYLKLSISLLLLPSLPPSCFFKHTTSA